MEDLPISSLILVTAGLILSGVRKTDRQTEKEEREGHMRGKKKNKRSKRDRFQSATAAIEVVLSVSQTAVFLLNPFPFPLRKHE
jgi:hypothetical protein